MLSETCPQDTSPTSSIHTLVAEAYFPTLPKIELNARRARPGWVAWGNEAPDSPDENVVPPAAVEAGPVHVAAAPSNAVPPDGGVQGGGRHDG
jgi:hypothetical protein